MKTKTQEQLEKDIEDIQLNKSEDKMEESHFFIRLLGTKGESEERIRKLLLSGGTIDDSELIIKSIEGTEDLEELNKELAKDEDNKKSSSYLLKLKAKLSQHLTDIKNFEKLIDDRIQIQEKFLKEQPENKKSIQWRIIGLKEIKEALKNL